MTIRLSKKKIMKGAPMPLFERLVDTEPKIKSEMQVKNILDEEGLKASIAQELRNIFDSRIGSEIDIPEGVNHDYIHTPQQFGIRDFAALTAQSESGKRSIASHLRAAIERFEPRLKNPKVLVTVSNTEDFDIEVAISGEIFIDNMSKKIQFPMVLSNVLSQK